ACVEASGPRTCVFAVGGTIALEQPLYTEDPFLTVAGQTAPGGGIQITNAPGAEVSALVYLAAHDVVWQYTRLRNQFQSACTDGNGSECGALFATGDGSVRVIADHNSLAWNQDEGFGVWANATAPLQELTLSANLIALGLESHSTGIIVGGEDSAAAGGVTDVDIHHNLILNNNHRNPLFKGRSGRLVANLFYNQGFYVTQVGGGASVDIVGNEYREGPMNEGFHEIQAWSASGTDARDGEPSLYVSGNRGWNQPDPDGDQVPLTYRVDGENGDEVGALDPGWLRAEPLPPPSHPIPHGEPLEDVLVPTVGASRGLDCDGAWVDRRDPIDALLIEQLLADDGISRLPVRDDGLPTLDPGEPCPDADADGMPDGWEADHGLSSDDPDDHAAVAAAGFTALELYLSGRFPVGTPLPAE
ncbi:MAG: hypothetical protein ABMA64_34970, partial [Myxococcota bacterium]